MVSFVLRLALSDVVQANATSSIIGTVKDSTGPTLPAVELTTREVTRFEGLTTDCNGGFSVAALPVGDYSIRAELPHFRTQVRRGVVLQVGREEHIDLVMELGQVAEESSVVQSAPPIRGGVME